MVSTTREVLPGWMAQSLRNPSNLLTPNSSRGMLDDVPSTSTTKSLAIEPVFTTVIDNLSLLSCELD